MAETPAKIGKYRVDRKLGEGGMGTVYLAHDEGIDRYVAIKLLRADDEQMRRRFRAEVQAVGKLKHPNIVIVHDYIDFEGSPCIVMEYVEGESLFSLIRRGEPLPVAQRLFLIEQVCRGLAYAHRAGIVHRDIKPSNLMVDGGGAMKIVDFGIARTTERGLTHTGKVIGTPAYMAPEQIRGETVDGRCDIFATGIVLYELLTGNVAFPGDSDYSIQNRIVTGPPEPFRHPNALLTGHITPVIEKALAKDPANRFENADRLADQLAVIRKQLERSTGTDAGTVVRLRGSVIAVPQFRDEPTVAPVRPTPATAPNLLPSDSQMSVTHVIEPRRIPRADQPTPAPIPTPAPGPVRKRVRYWAVAAGLAAAIVGVVLWRNPNLVMPSRPDQIAENPGDPVTKPDDIAGPAGQPSTPADAGADSGEEATRRLTEQLATAAFLFEEGEFDGAETAYQAVLKQDVQNGAALGGLRAIEKALAAEPPARETPLTEEAITQLVAAGSPGGRLRLLIASGGLDLGLADPEMVELRLRKLGIPPAALSALSPPASPVAGTVWTSPIDQLAMVYVAAGRVRMGSPPSEQGRDDDEIAHEVGVSNGFWMDVTEVSNEAYRRFVLSRPEWQKGKVRSEMAGSAYLQNWNRTDYPAGMADAPVEFVSWHASRAYANWAGKRLPTELEWEFAARAGTTTRFWWGEQFEPQRVIGGDRYMSAERPALRTNPWGLRDVTGSVWEWTLSLNLPYPYIATDARQNPTVPGARVIRGGSRADGEAALRAANRHSENATAASAMLGFRCAR